LYFRLPHYCKTQVGRSAFSSVCYANIALSAMSLKLLMSFCTLSNFLVKETIAIFPNGSRNGGVSSLVMSIIACAAFIGL